VPAPPAFEMASAVTSALACVALTVLATSQSLLVEAAKARGGGKIPYDTSAAVLLTEALKLGIALCTWLWQRKSLNYTGLESFQLVSWPTAAYAVPATFFIVQNNLVFLALSLLDPPTFQLWACFKIIPVGVLARLMLGQRRSSVQWVSLLLLSLGMGVTTTKQDSGAGTKATTENNPTDSQSGKSGTPYAVTTTPASPQTSLPTLSPPGGRVCRPRHLRAARQRLLDAEDKAALKGMGRDARHATPRQSP